MSNETGAGHRQLNFALISSKVNKLQSDRHYRDGKGLFFAEGVRNFVEAVDHDYPVDTILYSEKLLVSPVARKLVRRLKRNGIPFARASPEQFRVLSKTERASGIAAIFRQKTFTLNRIKPDSHICWTALSHIRSPGNFGTLVRTSAAVGAGGFILIGNDIDPFDPVVVRSTMGALFRQTIIRANDKQFQAWIKSHKLQVIGAAPAGSIDYDKARYSSPTVLMLGSERSGLSAAQLALCGQTVRIPMTGSIDSLNVAVAGSLLLYEVFRSVKRE